MSLGSNSQTRLQRGHFTLKSSVLAPTAMSYMGQDFIANHMKSHYRRITSAKAAVDTSPPKSMKTHIKVRDQKKRAALESRAGTPSLRTRSPSVEFLSSTNNETSFLNSTRNWQSSDRRQATGTPIQRSMSTQSLDRHYPPAVPSSSPRDLLIQDRSTPASARILARPPISPITKEPRQKTTRRNHYISRHGSNQGTLQTLDKSEPIGSDKLNGNVSTLLTSYDEPSDMKNPATAAGNSSDDKRLTRTDVKSGVWQDFGNSNMSIRHDYSIPPLDLTGVQYSHRGPPSIRASDSTDFKASICNWKNSLRMEY
ncbi:uncharacterized protein LOC110046759 [Orbicella faveolata]|uniref:uncharacterized protein LOC110046759 n=1 Tax=Orbicella faveolata TaxID=48498 RepID=UPI0009E60E5E|nr:uncharacterized protein LOC110046759 [Orbicella faveolata]